MIWILNIARLVSADCRNLRAHDVQTSKWQQIFREVFSWCAFKIHFQISTKWREWMRRWSRMRSQFDRNAHLKYDKWRRFQKLSIDYSYSNGIQPILQLLELEELRNCICIPLSHCYCWRTRSAQCTISCRQSTEITNPNNETRCVLLQLQTWFCHGSFAV